MKTYAPKIAALVALLTITLAGSGQQADNAATPKKTAKLAHFRLHGDLDESPVAADPIFGTAAENFKAKLERIKKAAKDPDVQGLIIHLDGVTGGWAKIEELRKAIAGARKAGKKVFAYLEDGSARDQSKCEEAGRETIAEVSLK